MRTQVNGLDIKIARLKAGIRQYDLAAWLSIHPSRLSEIESGRRKPSPELLEQLVQILRPSNESPNGERQCGKATGSSKIQS